jgi:hypothetical protein
LWRSALSPFSLAVVIRWCQYRNHHNRFRDYLAHFFFVDNHVNQRLRCPEGRFVMSLNGRLTTAFVAVVAVLVPATVTAQDRESCSNHTLHGSYGLHATGTIIDVGNFAAVGRFTFDGNGTLTGQLFARVNGNNNELTLTGTYSVSSDCTVSDTWNFSDGSSSTHKSVIVDEGKKYFILNNTEGDPSVISGEAERQ